MLTLYIVLALGFTWPLLRHITTHVPGDGIDDPSLAWNLWWINERLVHQVTFDIFHVDWMFHPIGINLGFYTLTPLNGLLSVPLQGAFSLIITNNLILLSSFVLGGLGVYLLVQQELSIWQSYSPRPHRRHVQLAAFVAGTLYAFASAKLFYAALGQFNIASSQWVPFCLIYLLRLARSQSYAQANRNALLAALFLIFQAWAELTYASFLIIFAVLLFGWTVFAERFRRVPIRLSSFALLAGTFVVGIAPFLWAMIPDLLTEGDFFASGGGFADQYSADVAGYLLPTQLHPLFGSWVQQLPFPHDKGQQIYLGYTVLLLAIGGTIFFVQRARNWGIFWLSMTLFFWWLTLGAEVRWLGQGTGIPGPFALVSKLPFFSGNRYPSRYSVLLLACVAVLAGAGVMALLRWSARRKRATTLRRSYLLTIGILAFFTLEQVALPLPLSDFRTPSIYRQLAALPTEGTLLELPTGWRNGARVMGKSDLLIMLQQWYQTTHGRPRLGGNTSRNPAYKFGYFINAPLLGDLIALMNANPQANPAEDEIARVVESDFADIVARNRPIAGTVLDFLDVAYVTVHVEKASPALLRFIDEALPLTLIDTWTGRDWSGAPSTIRLYQPSIAPQPNQWTIDLAASTAPLYLAEGWSYLPWQGVRYATRPCATLLLDVPPAGGSITVVLGALKTMTATLNGEAIRQAATTTDPTMVTYPIQPGLAKASVDRLQLCTDQATPITALNTPQPAAGWPIGDTGGGSQGALLVQSAGNDVGNYAAIRYNGELLLAGATGYNLVALDTTGTLLAATNFNTHISEEEADALAAWIEQWPVDTIIAGAIMDEGTLALNQRAIDAFATIGVATDLRATDLRKYFRWSHAFIGVVGSPMGTAVEEAALIQSATVAVGPAIDAPTVYVGVEQVIYQGP